MGDPPSDEKAKTGSSPTSKKSESGAVKTAAAVRLSEYEAAEAQQGGYWDHQEGNDRQHQRPGAVR